MHPTRIVTLLVLSLMFLAAPMRVSGAESVVTVAPSEQWPHVISSEKIGQLKSVVQGTLLDASKSENSALVALLSDVEYPRQTDARFAAGLIEGFTSGFEKEGGKIIGVVQTAAAGLDGYAVTTEIPLTAPIYMLNIVLFTERRAFYVQFVGRAPISIDEKQVVSYLARLVFDKGLVPLKLNPKR